MLTFYQVLQLQRHNSLMGTNNYTSTQERNGKKIVFPSWFLLDNEVIVDEMEE